MVCAWLKHDTLVLSKVSNTRIIMGGEFENTENLDKTVPVDGRRCLWWELGCHYSFVNPAVSSSSVITRGSHLD